MPGNPVITIKGLCIRALSGGRDKVVVLIGF